MVVAITEADRDELEGVEDGVDVEVVEVKDDAGFVEEVATYKVELVSFQK